MRYGYYPGCSLMVSARDYDVSARSVMAALGVELEELGDWNCCGGGAVSSVDPDLAMACSARNLALAEARGLNLATACAACYTNLRRARVLVQGKAPASERVRSALAEVGRTVTGTSEVHHLLELMEVEKVRAKVTKPLTGLKVAAYYGCQMGRPAGGFVHREIPTELDDFLAALGATPLDWKGRVRCCGSTTIMTKEEAALGLVDSLLADARAAGAHMIATACPLCQMNLDAYQGQLEQTYNLPVVYFTQLAAAAMGLDPHFGLGFVPPEPVLREVVR